MKYRRFGRTGWRVSEIGYGMWGMAGWTGSDDRESMKSLQRAVELGCNFFDTAWSYGNGHSEKLLGQLVRLNRARRLYVATKIPPKNLKWPSREYTLDECYPPDHIEDYVHRSVANLGLETIDLVQFHTWDDSWLEDDRWATKLGELKRQGLLLSIGISINRWEPWNGVRAVRSGLIDSVQLIYNVFDQNPDDDLLPACREHDVAAIARAPFDEGSLTGTLTKNSTWPDGDWRNSYFATENLNATVDRVEALKLVLPPGMRLPEAALRFILMNPAISTVIPGMRKPRHVDANLATSDATPLPSPLYAALRNHRWERKPRSRSK